MASISSENLSKTENFFLLLGITTTGLGAMNLADGNLAKGVAEIVVGNYQTTFATLFHSENFRHQAIAANLVTATIPLVLQGLTNIFSTLPTQTRKGYTQVTAATTVFYVTTKLPPRILSIFINAITIASASGLVAYSGIKDIAEGKPLSGTTKALVGAGGVLLSGAAAYCEITNSLA